MKGLSISVFEKSYVIGRPLSIEPLRIFAQTLYLWKLYSLTYILPLIVWVYLHSNFSGELGKTTFSARMHFGSSRSYKVIDFSTNRKRSRDFPLVPHSNPGPILHRFGDIAGFLLMTPLLFHSNFLGCSHWIRSP